jgi:hypothetical protein
MMTTPRIGRRMAEIQAIVSCMPRISKRGALAAAGLPLSGPGRNAPLHRAVAAGLVVIERERVNRYRCFASARDQRAWHLRQEALSPGTPVTRVAEIAAEIRALDAERAATWTDA